jgi:tetratricopeptide (TPR) repeat protein
MAEFLDQDQLVKEAQAAYEGGDFIKAAELFVAAQESYHTVGGSLRAAEMANNASVALLRAGEPERAFQVLAGVDEFFEATANFRGLGMTLGNRATALEALGRRDEAYQDYQKSADFFKQVGDNELYTATMQSLSALQLRSGRSLEALATMQAGINVIEHPKLTHRLLKRLLDIPYRLLNR